MRNLILMALLSAGVPAMASADVSLPKSLLTMSPEAFQQKTVVKDDPLEFHVTFSTEAVSKRCRGGCRGTGIPVVGAGGHPRNPRPVRSGLQR